MNRGRNTLILLVLGAALGAYIYFVERKREPASDTPGTTLAKVFDGVESSKIEEIRLRRSGGDETTIARRDEAWQIVTPVVAAADETEASSIASSLSTLEVQRVVDEQPKDLGAYGLAEPRVEIAFRTAGDKAPRRLLLGDKTPTGGEIYAKLDGRDRVFLVSSYLEGTFDKSTFQLRDKRVLTFDREKVDAIEVRAGRSGTKIVKQGDAWTIAEPLKGRADFGAVESLLSRLTGGQMKSIVAPPDGQPEPALRTYGLDPAERQVVVAAGSTSASLLLGQAAPEGDVYAKDASRPIVFTIEKTLADDLAKTAGDFRMKDLFGFRAFTGTRLEIARGGSTIAFEKKKGTEQDAVEKWSQVQPQKSVEESKIEDLVSKVASLRAESFVDALPAGAAEAARISTKFDENKKEETVVLHKAGDDYFATRADEAGAAKVPKAEVEAVFTALDETQKVEAKT